MGRAAQFSARTQLLLFCLALACCVAPGGVARFEQDSTSRSAKVGLQDGVVAGIAAAGGKAWLGIPYAHPPIGLLRWQAPKAVAPWVGVRDARRLGRDCTQNLSPGSLLGRPGGLFVRGSEDCLVLNVYAPSNAVAGQGWPVMVWLHGGGFAAGTASNYDPSVLVQKQGVIVVTLNYRLGAFGFLAHPALSAEEPATGSGDYGLLDQQAALAWVQRNIAAFGGDPAKVTLFGESAGGFSACHQLTSPLAVHLFSGVIIQSGACTARAQNEPKLLAEAAGEQLAKDVGCDAVNDAAECLRKIPARRLARTVSHRLGALGPNSWGAVVGTPVLPVDAGDAFAMGAFTKVPVILGVNHDEGRLFGLLQLANGRLWSAPSYHQLLQHDYGPTAASLEARFPVAKFSTPAAAYAALITDTVFACPAKKMAKLLSIGTTTWLYEFDDPNAATSIPRFLGTPVLGASHATEIAYILQRRWIMADPATFDLAQRALSERMQDAWGAFARTGEPTGLNGQPWSSYPSIQILRPPDVPSRTSVFADPSCAE
jgi:para-nitrobenzyl esterase